MKFSLERKIALGFGAASLVLLLVAAAWINARRLNASHRLVDHTHQVLNRLQEVTISILAMQTSTRGFALTGSEELLAPFNQGQADLAASIAQLRELTADNPSKKKPLDRVETIANQAAEIMRGRIAARRARGSPTDADKPAFLEGQQTVETLRAVVQAMAEEENRLLDARFAASEASAKNNLIAIVVIGLTTTALVVFSTLRVRHEFNLRHQTEDTLRQSQQMFQRLFENAPDATLLVDRSGRIVRANAQTETLFRCPLDELAGQNFATLLPEKHRADRGKHLASYFAAPRAQAIGTAGLELVTRRSDGSEFPADIMLSPLETEDGPQALAVIRDISERKRVEQIHLQFRALFESLPGSYLVLTPGLKIVAVSDAYLAATMTKREEIMGHDLFEIFPDNPADANANGTSNLRASLDRVRHNLASDTMAIQRYPVRRPDGVFEERYWSPVNSPVLNADRRIEYIVHRVEDVTDFVRQKESGAVTDGGMRARVQQMEAEVYQSAQKVQAANLQLQAANTELESFAYSVSHDLRAPLRHIDGFAGLLQKNAGGALDDKGHRYLTTIIEAARQMGRLIDDLLAFSRMSRAPLEATDLDHDALVATAIRDGHFEKPERAITWVIAPLPRVVADAAMLRQVWVNLIDNAVKYSGKNPAPRIEIGHQPSGSGHDAACFIRDNGVGFDMKYAGKLFGVFQRLHSPADFPGTGVGLANVRRIVARHGGRTWAESRPNEGATFYFFLPQTATASPPAPALRS